MWGTKAFCSSGSLRPGEAPRAGSQGQRSPGESWEGQQVGPEVERQVAPAHGKGMKPFSYCEFRALVLLAALPWPFHPLPDQERCTPVGRSQGSRWTWGGHQVTPLTLGFWRPDLNLATWCVYCGGPGRGHHPEMPPLPSPCIGNFPRAQ